MHTSWSRFCTVNHRASASNYQLSNMKPRFKRATSEVEGKHSSRYTFKLEDGGGGGHIYLLEVHLFGPVRHRKFDELYVCSDLPGPQHVLVRRLVVWFPYFIDSLQKTGNQ